MSKGKIIASVIGFFVIICILMVALWGFGVLTADIKGKGDVYKETHEAGYRMEAYNHFYDMDASIKSLEGQIDVNVAQLKTMDPTSSAYSRVQTNITALKSLRHQAIQQYNADARKDYTLARWLPADLPYQIADTDYTGEK